MSAPIPGEVEALCAADNYAEKCRDAVMTETERAYACMRGACLPRARHHLTEALRRLDALEARLTEIRGQR